MRCLFVVARVALFCVIVCMNVFMYFISVCFLFVVCCCCMFVCAFVFVCVFVIVVVVCFFVLWL